MPHYDPDEDPVPIINLYPMRADSPGPVFPTNKPLQTCYAGGINQASDTDTPGMQSPCSEMPYHSHRRRSTLSRVEHQVEDPVSRIFSEAPVFDDSPETGLAESERKRITQIEASEEQDDDVRMILHSDRRAREKATTYAWECVHADECFEESHVRDDSWVRSRPASCDLFVQSHKREVGDCQSGNVAGLSSERPDHGQSSLRSAHFRLTVPSTIADLGVSGSDPQRNF